MILSAMQPYFLPYLGYFQLMEASDVFMVADDYNFIRDAWSNRNRILIQGIPAYINIPLLNASVNKTYNEITINDSEILKRKILKKIYYNYSKAVEFSKVFPLLEEIILYPESNFALFLLNSYKLLCNFLDLRVEFTCSSSYYTENNLDKSDRIIALIKATGADTFINPIGGQSLYSKEYFKANGIDLFFLKPQDHFYKQFNNEFIPWLSIIDVMMFNSKPEVKKMLKKYRLI